MTTRCWSVANCLAALRPGLFGKLSRGRSIYGSHTTHAAAAPYFSLVRHALGKPNARVAPFPWWLLRIAGLFAVTARELMEMRYLWQRAIRLNNARLVATLGAEPHTPLALAVRTTLGDMGCLP